MEKNWNLLVKIVFGCLGLGLLVQLNNAFGHHAAAPHYDLDKDLVIEGAVITELKLVNPHSFLYFEARDEDGEVSTWRCGLRPAVALRRQGWNEETFVKGEVVTIKGNPARREENLCLVQTIVLSDGTEIGPTSALNGTVSTRDFTKIIPSDNRDRSAPLANGQPDISGDWVSMSFGRGGLGGQSKLPNNGFDPTEANIAAGESYDVRFDDPATKCHPINIIQGWNHDSNINKISQLDDRVILTYGWMDLVRTIYLDAEHPNTIEPSISGHSIGTWEDDVLVVDTIGFLPGVMSHRVGILHSDQMRISERFHYDEANQELIRDYVVEDPLYLKTPYISRDRQRSSAVPYAPYNCVELSGDNNVRPDA